MRATIDIDDKLMEEAKKTHHGENKERTDKFIP